MIRLSRAVRCSVNDAPSAGVAQAGPPVNGYAAHPPMQGLGRHYELVLECWGEVDPLTGYFLSISEIDRAARTAVLPLLEDACRSAPQTEPTLLLPALVRAASAALEGRLHSLTWRLSPTYSVRMETQQMDRAIIRQSFEFAASHVLHSPSLSPEQNRALFGKCNNPSGHGHNYRIEPAVAVPAGSSAFGLPDLERITDEVIIRRLDHTHLNRDVPEFAGDALNPSVENISKVCFDLLRPAVAAASGGAAALLSVTVWETEKTSCVYPG